MSEPIACIHCGGIANHRAMPDGSMCPTGRVLELLRAGQRAVEAVLPEPPRTNGPGGKA